MRYLFTSNFVEYKGFLKYEKYKVFGNKVLKFGPEKLFWNKSPQHKGFWKESHVIWRLDFLGLFSCASIYQIRRLLIDEGKNAYLK